jgi:hypothetical protein
MEEAANGRPQRPKPEECDRSLTAVDLSHRPRFRLPKFLQNRIRRCAVGQINGLYAASSVYQEAFVVLYERTSELVAISKLNGDFKRNYGRFIGAYLYLRSISATRRGSFFWAGPISIVCSAVLTWFQKYGIAWLHGG